MSISLAASPITWETVREDAKRYGFNTIASYTQKLYEDSHNNLKKNSRRNKLLKFSLVLLGLLGWVLLIFFITRFA